MVEMVRPWPGIGAAAAPVLVLVGCPQTVMVKKQQPRLWRGCLLLQKASKSKYTLLKQVHGFGKISAHKRKNEPEPLAIRRKHHCKHGGSPKEKQGPMFAGTLLCHLFHCIGFLFEWRKYRPASKCAIAIISKYAAPAPRFRWPLFFSNHPSCGGLGPRGGRCRPWPPPCPPCGGRCCCGGFWPGCCWRGGRCCWGGRLLPPP